MVLREDFWSQHEAYKSREKLFPSALEHWFSTSALMTTWSELWWPVLVTDGCLAYFSLLPSGCYFQFPPLPLINKIVSRHCLWPLIENPALEKRLMVTFMEKSHISDLLLMTAYWNWDMCTLSLSGDPSSYKSTCLFSLMNFYLQFTSPRSDGAIKYVSWFYEN